MPEIVDRSKLEFEEQLESSMPGPFGGVQSELPPTEIETLGFLSSDNIIFRIGRASLRPGYISLGKLPGNEPILGIASFFNVSGTDVQVVLTPTKLYRYLAGSWVEITGAGFTGTTEQLFAADVLNYKLCFSQGVDKLWVWDGVAASYSLASASAPPARFIAEVGVHLLCVDPAYPQRYNWSGSGDATDWTSYSSGLSDIVNNMGPINGLLKLGQYGFGFHQNGIVQVVPTGVGLAPFAFYPIINQPYIVAAPYSLQKYIDQGFELSVSLGIDNVYVFNGTSLEPIGDRPLSGQTRVGARTAILQDVFSAGMLKVTGMVTYQVAGNAFRAYWLVIPPNRIWVYNFDEGNWTRFIYSSTNAIRTVGQFLKQDLIRIKDLVGSVSQQTWTPATLSTNNPFAGVLLAFNDGTPGYVDLTQPSELDGSVVSGQVSFGDRRHRHTIKKFRIRFVDRGQATMTLKIMNETNRTESHTFTLGNGSGQVLSYVQPFNISGLRFIWTLTLAAGTRADLVEFAPIYDIGGEQRCGVIEN